MKKNIDIVLFGATGFTGTLCLRYLKNKTLIPSGKMVDITKKCYTRNN